MAAFDAEYAEQQRSVVSSRSVLYMTDGQAHRKRELDRANQRSSRARAKNKMQQLEAEISDLKQRLEASEAATRAAEARERQLRTAIETVSQVVRPCCPDDTAIPAMPMTLFDPGTGIGLDLDMPHAGAEWLGMGVVGDLDGSKSSTASQGLLQLATWDGAPGDTDDMAMTIGNTSVSAAAAAAASWTTTETQPPQPPPSPPLWEMTLSHVPATCRLDSVILHVVGARHTAELQSRSFPSVASLLNPSRRETQYYPVSAALGQHASWMSVPSLPNKLAMLYCISAMARWLARPTRDNWLAMPPFLRPVDAQRARTHPAWIDTVAWPQAREAILDHMDWSRFDAFRAKTSAAVSINWPGRVQDVFEVNVGDGELMLNETFRRHIRDIRNWTVDTDWTEDFPFLEGVIPKTQPG